MATKKKAGSKRKITDAGPVISEVTDAKAEAFFANADAAIPRAMPEPQEKLEPAPARFVSIAPSPNETPTNPGIPAPSLADPPCANCKNPVAQGKTCKACGIRAP